MDSFKLATIQFTPEFGEKEKNLSRIKALTDSLEADIIVLPELCTTGYFFSSFSKNSSGLVSRLLASHLEII